MNVATDNVHGMELDFNDYRVLLRHAGQPTNPATVPAKLDFVAIVSARDAAGARIEAEKIVATLNNLVRIVSIEPRRPDDRYLSQLERDLKSPTVQMLLRLCVRLNVQASRLIAQLEAQPQPRSKPLRK